MATQQALAQIKKEKKKFIGFIGGYLIDDRVLTLEQLDRGILRQMYLAEEGRVIKLGQVLVEMGFVTQADLARAMERHAADQVHLKKPASKKKK